MVKKLLLVIVFGFLPLFGMERIPSLEQISERIANERFDLINMVWHKTAQLLNAGTRLGIQPDFYTCLFELSSLFERCCAEQSCSIVGCADFMPELFSSCSSMVMHAGGERLLNSGYIKALVKNLPYFLALLADGFYQRYGSLEAIRDRLQTLPALTERARIRFDAFVREQRFVPVLSQVENAGEFKIMCFDKCGAFAGTIICVLEKDGVGFIDLLSIERNFYNRGIGTFLLMCAFCVLRCKGVCQVQLKARSLDLDNMSQQALIQFYQSFGFKAYDHEGELCLMKRDL